MVNPIPEPFMGIYIIIRKYSLTSMGPIIYPTLSSWNFSS